jgi:hypothetical protein
VLDDLIKAIKAQLHDRVTSPLSGAFIVSWAIWNYKVIVMLLADMSAIEKLTYIDAHLFPTAESVLVKGILSPLLFALVFLFAYPFPSKYVYEYTRRRQKELKQIQQEIDDETPITQEEARELRRESVRIMQDYEQQLAQRSAEVTRLRDLLAEAQKKDSAFDISSLPLSGPPNLEELNNEQEEILLRIANNEGKGISPSVFINQPDVDKVLVRHHLDELERFGYTTGFFEGNQHFFTVTPKGRTYLVKRRIKTLAA